MSPPPQLATVQGWYVSRLVALASCDVVPAIPQAIEAEADDELESTAAYDKLSAHVAALVSPIFKATKERNYNIRDLAVKTLAWVLQVRATCMSNQTPTMLRCATLSCCALTFGSLLLVVSALLQIKPDQVTDAPLVEALVNNSKDTDAVKGVKQLLASAKLHESLNAFAGGVA